MNEQAGPDNGVDEVSRFSLWFLRAALILVALVVLAFVVQAAWSLLDDDSSADDSNIDDSNAEPADEQPPDADPSQVPSELDAFVDEAIAFIEAERGRPFLDRPIVELVDSDQFVSDLQAEFAEDLSEDAEQLESFTTIYRALGLIGADQTLIEVYEAFVSGGVAGVYSTDDKILRIRSTGELDMNVRNVIVHELVHAYDDQHIGLDRDEDFDDSTEQAFTFSAAAEGSASYMDSLWLDAQGPNARAEAEAASLAGVDLGALLELDLSFLLIQLAPYVYGEQWVAELIEQQGWSAVEAEIASPPLTSEEVLEPLGASGLEPVVVPSPVDLARGDVVYEGVGGQAALQALFEGTNTASSEAASGWGGDAVVAWLSDGQSCLIWDIATDSSADRDELHEAFERWVDLRGGSVSVVDNLVRLERCAS